MSLIVQNSIENKNEIVTSITVRGNHQQNIVHAKKILLEIFAYVISSAKRIARLVNSLRILHA